MPTRPLTLIVATTPSWGIGFQNTLPWPTLKAEMAYFARITKRLPKAAHHHHDQHISNAVIMGRNTWESIPTKFRPLKDRLNVVLTRNPGKIECAPQVPDGPLVAGSISEALRVLEERREQVGRVFVIGGAEVYAQAMRVPNCTRVLRTKVEREFECDVVFPVDLERDSQWERAGQEALSEWVGEDVPSGWMEQDGVRWEYQMWERGGEVTGE